MRVMKAFWKGDHERTESVANLKNAVDAFHNGITNAMFRITVEIYELVKRTCVIHSSLLT